MRLLLLTPGFAADEGDYNCIPPLQLLVQELLGRGAEVQIVALEYPFRNQPYRWHGARVYPCDGRNRRRLKARTLWRAQRFLQHLTQAGAPTAVHSFWLGWASWLAERWAQQHRLFHLTTLMGQDVLPENSFHLNGLTTERFSRLVALSAFHNQVFEKNTGRPAAYCIPWGLAELEVPLHFPPERPLDVLGAGSLVAVKNWAKWLQVVAKACQDRQDLRAELVGDGPERAALQHLAQRLGLTQNLHFAGNMPRPALLQRMQASKVLLHTADFESFGFVFAEAAASGCRIVSTPVGVGPELGTCAVSANDLTRLLLTAAAQPLPTKPVLRNTMSQTAAAYWQCYESGRQR